MYSALQLCFWAVLTSSILDNSHLSLSLSGAPPILDGIFEVFNHSCQILNSSTIKFVLLPKDLDIWICESKYASEVVSGFGHRVPSDFLSQVSASPFSYINFNNRFSYIKLKNQGKKHLWKNIRTVFLFSTGNQFYKTLPKAQRTLECSCQSNFFRSHHKFSGMW